MLICTSLQVFVLIKFAFKKLVGCSSKLRFVNSLSPNSDKHPISPHSVPTWSNMYDMRIKEMITKDEMSWYLKQFP